MDTYEPMVELARRRLAATPVGARSQVQASTVEDLAEQDFDAATCILTAHFVPDDGAKLAFFEAIRARLKPGRASRHRRRRWRCRRTRNGASAADLEAACRQEWR
ncbi:hypothetical protein AUC71_00265 [Methyloceanibacter marginalis]|uniref:Methyltransferase domain-containing protein n=1 Tax=Methyloceanibacter marginalis TaxID=1774971 RepID=A0A1E3W6Q4_9HYPH|nr:hypothetical protein AUC71_00265 [Methyloceanibacter marginalis]